MTSGDGFYIDRRKWSDRPHYRHVAHPLGEDEFGLWVACPVGTPIMRGDELLFAARQDAVMCVAAGRRWMAFFPVTGRFELYCDVVTPIEIGPERVLTVDLDLDVVRWRDGRVELLDEDEFAEHRVLYGYPEDECEHAQRAATDLVRAVEASEPPFDGWAERWLEAMRRRAG